MHFEWSPISGKKVFKVVGKVKWDLYAIFNAETDMGWTINSKPLLEFGQSFPFYIGPIPVVIKPFITLGFEIDIGKFKLNAGAEWHHGSNWTIGYEYNSTDSQNPGGKRIMTREPGKKNGFTKNVLTLKDVNGKTCPLEVSSLYQRSC